MDGDFWEPRELEELANSSRNKYQKSLSGLFYMMK